MQVINGVGTTLFIWVSKWHGHMATRTTTMTPTAIIYGVLMLLESRKTLTLMRGESRAYLLLVLKMENDECLTPVMPPLAYNYLPAVVEPSSQKAIGRRCQLLCCIEIIEGVHFSHNSLCCYRISTSTLNSTTIS